MPYKRLLLSGAVFLAVVYLRFAMPALFTQVMPPLRTALGQTQSVFILTEETAAWLGWKGT